MEKDIIDITIKELVESYEDNAEAGVVGYSGKLDIRPPFQREFIYKDDQRDAVIETVLENLPLNMMFWAVKSDGNFEIIDGQQRTLSICQYVNNEFSYEGKYFANQPADIKEKILKYRLIVHKFQGTDSEKLKWFKKINIAGEELTDQELRNAVFSGSWLSKAKIIFSKTGCQAHNMGGKYIKGSAIRQEILETAIKWISKNDIEEYMGTHQDDDNANELWNYFQAVINWVQATFPKYRKEMQGVPWGFLYNDYKDKNLNIEYLAGEIAKLMQDEDVSNKKGIYSYVLNGEEKHLNIRSFTPKQKTEAYAKQKGICPTCKKHFEIEEMEADHITPWHEGGPTNPDNCQMLCKADNRRKSGR